METRKIALVCEHPNDLKFVINELVRGLREYEATEFESFDELRKRHVQTRFTGVVLIRSRNSDVFGNGRKFSDKFPHTTVVYYGNFSPGELAREEKDRMVQMTSRPEDDAAKIREMF